jgi:hypothetical protein
MKSYRGAIVEERQRNNFVHIKLDGLKDALTMATEETLPLTGIQTQLANNLHE